MQMPDINIECHGWELDQGLYTPGQGEQRSPEGFNDQSESWILKYWSNIKIIEQKMN